MKSFDVAGLAERDFGFFFRVVLRQKYSSMYGQIIDAVVNGKSDLVVMAYRGSGKTNLLSVAFPLWHCFRTPSKNLQEIAILSASMEQSTTILRKIKQHIQSNPILRERLMPDNLYNVKWSETQVELKNGHLITCKPFGDAIRGSHVNYCISDDILTEETTNVEEAKNTFYGPVYPVTYAKKGKHIVVGTPMSYTDLLHDLARPEKGLTYLNFPILTQEGLPQIPERLTLEEIAKIRRVMPSNKFAREMLLVPVNDETRLFPFETLLRPCLDMEYAVPTVKEEEGAQYVLGGDVAVSDKERADFACYTLLKNVPGHPWKYYKKFLFKGMGTGEQGEFVANLTKQYPNLNKIVVEQTGLSYGVVDFLSKDDRTRSVLEGFNTSQKSKFEILGLLETWLRNQQIKLDWDDSLFDELAGWEIITKDGKQIPRSTKAHDDQVMSLAFAVYAAAQMQSASGAFAIDRPVVDVQHKGLKDLSSNDVFFSIGDDDEKNRVPDLSNMNNPYPTADQATWPG